MKENEDENSDWAASSAVVSCLGRGLMFSLPGSCSGLHASNPKMRSNDNVTLVVQIQNPSQPHPPLTQTNRGQLLLPQNMHGRAWLVRDLMGSNGPQNAQEEGKGATVEKGLRNGPPS